MSIGTRTKAFEDGHDAKTRPDFITDEHLTYLDELRDSGETNMFGAAPYIEKEFTGLSREQARTILGYWMKTFGEKTR